MFKKSIKTTGKPLMRKLRTGAFVTGIALTAVGTANGVSADEVQENAPKTEEVTKPQVSVEEQYKEAKGQLVEATKAVETAQGAVNTAQAEATEATKAHEEAKKAVDDANKVTPETVEQAKSAVTKAEGVVKDTEATVNKAESSYKEASDAVNKANKVANEDKVAVVNTKDGVSDAEKALSDYKPAQDSKLNELDKASNDATAEVNLSQQIVDNLTKKANQPTGKGTIESAQKEVDTLGAKEKSLNSQLEEAKKATIVTPTTGTPLKAAQNAVTGATSTKFADAYKEAKANKFANVDAMKKAVKDGNGRTFSGIVDANTPGAVRLPNGMWVLPAALNDIIDYKVGSHDTTKKYSVDFKDGLPANVVEELTSYALGLMNQIQRSIGEPEFVATKESAKIANDTAEFLESGLHPVSSTRGGVAPSNAPQKFYTGRDAVAKFQNLRAVFEFEPDAYTGDKETFSDVRSINKYSLDDLMGMVHNSVLDMYYNTKKGGNAKFNRVQRIEELAKDGLQLGVSFKTNFGAGDAHRVGSVFTFSRGGGTTSSVNPKVAQIEGELTKVKAELTKAQEELTNAKKSEGNTKAIAEAKLALPVAQTKLASAKEAKAKADKALADYKATKGVDSKYEDLKNAVAKAKTALAGAEAKAKVSAKALEDAKVAENTARTNLLTARKNLTKAYDNLIQATKVLNEAKIVLTNKEGKVKELSEALPKLKDAETKALAKLEEAKKALEVAKEAEATAKAKVTELEGKLPKQEVPEVLVPAPTTKVEGTQNKGEFQNKTSKVNVDVVKTTQNSKVVSTTYAPKPADAKGNALPNTGESYSVLALLGVSILGALVLKKKTEEL
ncbi:SEC10/PgrA surface exclusion domain-containing protein [uncultured Streptococcus sp.]|uniref:SEC10/PgrA surface exclusion domain-containing protein n=1 Tax=uncultured Streptococcus sp. TaxID=83427 RepID=UPI00260EEA59|nr:SEC10/PgrA surface exclusion domain-containing protein [uncultured Streptococcus sp.]